MRHSVGLVAQCKKNNKYIVTECKAQNNGWKDRQTDRQLTQNCSSGK